MKSPLPWIILCAAAGCSEPSRPAPSADPPPEGLPAVAPVTELLHNRPTGPVSRSASKASAADLRKVADDRRADRAARAAAVFSLFANHLRPPRGAAAAGEVLGDAKWLDDAKFHRVLVVAGLVPVEFPGKGPVYCLYVFPMEDGWSDWVIYLRLSGDWKEDDLRAFLRGGKGLKGEPELVEFALCYPDRPGDLDGWVERFDLSGLRVMGGD
jgi:hypothetical protein